MDSSEEYPSERNNTRLATWIPKEWEEEIEEQLEYGESKSGWARDAIRDKLDTKKDRYTGE